MIKKIIFTGDLLRRGLSQYPADRFIKFAYTLFHKQIIDVTDVQVDIEIAKTPILFNRNIFYELNNLAVSEENWVYLYTHGGNDQSIEYFRNCFKDCLLIFQEAGAMRKIAEAAGILYLDMFNSSIRFLEDSHFAFRTNIDTFREKLNHYRLPEEYIYYNANMIKCYYEARNLTDNYNKNSLLICGQTESDLSLIQNDKMLSLVDFKDDIEKLITKFNKVYYKPHPYCNPNSKGEKFIRAFKNLEIINDNFYQMLSSDNIVAVAALSSGCLKEAPYFEKKIYTIAHPYIEYYKGIGIPKKDDYMIINDDYFSPSFWSDILSSIVETKQVKYINFNNRANLLRNTLNIYYGYEIGNDTYSNLKFEMDEIKRKHKFSYKFKRLLSSFIPNKKLRRKVRGEL